MAPARDPLSLQRLADEHDVEQFRCGNDELDHWFHVHAHNSDRMDSARVFVLAEDDGPIIGYFALSMTAVVKDQAPKKLVRGLPPHPVGAVLIARVAVAEGRQGEGLGGLLLAHAVLGSARAGDAAAARLVVVDAIDDPAAAFYDRFGFQSIPESPRQLYVRLRDAVASVEASGIA